MKRVCPGCRKTIDFTVAKCGNCHTQFFEEPKPQKDLADMCIPIAGVVFIAAIGAFVTMVLHPWI